MCNVCGCSSDGPKVEGHHHHDHDHDHHHHHEGHDHHHHSHHGDLHFGKGLAGVEVAGMSQKRLIEIETDVMSKNNAYAEQVRQRMTQAGILALNFVSSPGSGKTTLLCKTIESLSHPVTVIEGDQQTTNDADRIRETGARAIQVNTGKGCHLDAHMVLHALDHLKPDAGSVLFIENVGNLVCPAGFDLGEAAKVAVLSVTEGEDKPLKYPDIFAASRLVIVNKTDLAPYCDVDLDELERNIRRVNPSAEVLFLSAKTGEGMKTWLAWLQGRLAQTQALKAG